uniref:Uncharacterized protein n=1 Tax=Setaria italica TaxID=4555 RepID=K3ZZ05_SETIT
MLALITTSTGSGQLPVRCSIAAGWTPVAWPVHVQVCLRPWEKGRKPQLMSASF